MSCVGENHLSPPPFMDPCPAIQRSCAEAPSRAPENRQQSARDSARKSRTRPAKRCIVMGGSSLGTSPAFPARPGCGPPLRLLVLYICIPTYNEAETVGVLLWRIRKVFQEYSREYEVLVFDD